MNLRLALLLGAVQRRIGTLQEPVEVETMNRRECNPDAGGYLHLHIVDAVAFGKLADNAAREKLRLVRMQDAGLKDHKFIPSQAADDVIASHGSPQSRGDLDQQSVSDRMPELVVDRLEPV